MTDKQSLNQPGGTPPVVVYTPRGRDQCLASSLLERYGLRPISCGSFDELIGHAEKGSGPIVVAEEAMHRSGPSRLCAALNEQPNWSELPVIVLLLENGRARDGVQSLLGMAGVRWLTRPIRSQTLAGLVITSVEARRRQVQVRDLLREQAGLNAELKHRGEQLRELTVELVEAEDRERRRIAELLHDDLQQMLVGASLRIGAAINQLDQKSTLLAPLEQVRSLITDSQRRCRLLSHELFPAALRDGDLAAVLSWLAQQAESDYGLAVELDCDPQLSEVNAIIVRFVYRAAREMLLNVVKHAETNRVRVVARRGCDEMELVFSDRGAGFEPAKLETGERDGGIGLRTIRERVCLLGGTFTIESRPGEGSLFRLTIPLS